MFDLKMLPLGAGMVVAASIALAPSSAQAITLTDNAGGTGDYEVTTIDSAFFLAVQQLANTPWWTDGAPSALAQSLAGELNTQLPSSNPFNEGPYFAFGINDNNNDGIFTVSAWNWDIDNAVGQEVELDVDSNVLGTSFTWAVGEAAAVPTPALLPAMLGMGASIVRKRKKQSEASA